MRKLRSYQKLLNEIINITTPFKLAILGSVVYGKDVYPMIEMTHISKSAKKNLIIMSGQHGEEHYAVHILLKWFKQFKVEEYSDFNIYVYPVINPWGFECSSRKNGNHQETTNSIKFVKNSDTQELAILFDHMPSEVDLALDIHGDVDKHKLYAYERRLPDLSSIAEKGLIETDAILPYEKTRTIYGSKIKHGVISTPDHDVGIEDAMEKAGAEYTITIELPGKCDSQQRTSGGIAIINSVLRIYKEQNTPKKEEVKNGSLDKSN